MRRPDPTTLLASADAMADAADRVRPGPGDDAAPYLLLRALATELTLKALLLDVKGRFPRVHSLRALFGDLPDPVRDRIEALHRDLYRAHHPRGDAEAADAALAALLADAGDAFQAARYPYDHDLRAVPDPEPLRQVARGVLLKRIARTRPR